MSFDQKRFLILMWFITLNFISFGEFFHFHLSLCMFWFLLLFLLWPSSCLVACLIFTKLWFFSQLSSCSWLPVSYCCDQRKCWVWFQSSLHLLRLVYVPTYSLSLGISMCTWEGCIGCHLGVEGSINISKVNLS